MGRTEKRINIGGMDYFLAELPAGSKRWRRRYRVAGLVGPIGEVDGMLLDWRVVVPGWMEPHIYFTLRGAVRALIDARGGLEA
jgi:hypothetical protein